MEGCLIVRAPVRSWEKRSAYIDKVTLQDGGVGEEEGGVGEEGGGGVDLFPHVHEGQNVEILLNQILSA